jgi:hypothetical protein
MTVFFTEKPSSRTQGCDLRLCLGALVRHLGLGVWERLAIAALSKFILFSLNIAIAGHSRQNWHHPFTNSNNLTRLVDLEPKITANQIK